MNRIQPSPAGSRSVGRVARSLAFALSLPAWLAGQHPVDLKPPPVPDPVKGWHDMSPRSAEELARDRGEWRPARQLAGAARKAPARPVRDRVYYDEPGDGRIWAIGTTWKASFGADGFVYVPFFGSDAPRNFPVQFQLCSVRIGGHELPLAAAAPVHGGDRVTFARGAVTERYDLALEHVEQTFVIDSELAGDVDVELLVTSELVEDPSRTGLQFGNELGWVSYGDAHVVDAAGAVPVATGFDGERIRIHVQAGLRRGTRLVIDPIIQSSPVAFAVQASSQPDIAYDATFDRYQVVWTVMSSANDTDVWGELRDGNGVLVPGSLYVFDVTTAPARGCRVANLARFDRFLVVYQKYLLGHWHIRGRTANAANSAPSSEFMIADGGATGDCINPDVGGDPSDGPSANRWFVVWEREVSASDSDIHGRAVASDGTPASSTLLIENSASTVYTRPFISQSSGNGLTATPGWLVAYQFRHSATDYDIFGAVVGAGGTLLQASTGIDTSPNDDQVPNVSTPATDLGGTAPLYMVAYERVSPTSSAMARLVRLAPAGGFVDQIPVTNLTQSLSLPGPYVKCDSDGCRFAIACGVGNRLTTLALVGTQLVMQEPLQNTPGLPAYVRLVSKRSGGGPHTDYGVVDEDRSYNPYLTVMHTYRGLAPGSDPVRRVMACSGLHIDFAGRPFLGESMTFTLTNPGSDIPGFAFGAPMPAAALLCAQCPIGVNVGTAVLLVGANLPVPIVCNASLVGAQFSVQGLGLGSGPCVATLRFSDTIDFTVR